MRENERLREEARGCRCAQVRFWRQLYNRDGSRIPHILAHNRNICQRTDMWGMHVTTTTLNILEVVVRHRSAAARRCTLETMR
jgi:hypothetical protein